MLENIEDIIKYQDANINFEKIMDNYYNDEIIKKTTEIQTKRKKLEGIITQANAMISASEENSMPINNQELNELGEDIFILSDLDLDSCKDIDHIKSNIESINKLESQINDYIKVIKKGMEEKKNNTKILEEAHKQYLELERIYQGENGYKVKALAKKKETGIELEKIKAEIKESGEKLPQEIRVMYDEIKKNLIEKYPHKRKMDAKVFVSFTEGGYCFCSMALGNSELSKLATEGYVKCQNCGRIVYKQ